MADEANRTQAQRPVWLPDTQGFLAIAVVFLIAFVIIVLLLKQNINLNERVSGALLTVLGVVLAAFKDVYAWAFGSSQKEGKKDDAMAAIAAQPVPLLPPPTAPQSPTPWWTKLTDAEKNAITAAARGPAGGMPDARIGAFVTASQVGAATSDDLAYLVGKGLLTQARSDEIQS